MPDRITFDEALSSRKAAGITFDEAFERHQQRVGAHQQQQAQRTERGALMEQQLGDQLPRDITRAPGEMPSDPYLAQRSPIVAAPEKSNFGASLKAGLVEDPNTKRRLIAESLFPGDPNGIQRVGFADGEPVFVDDHGQLRRVSGSLVSTGANAIANAPELAGAAVGSFATGNPVTGTAVGGMGGRALKRGISQLAFDEPATPGSVATEMAVEGATNLAAGVVGKGVAKFGDRGKVVDYSPTNRAAAEQTRERVKQTTGIDLDLAQASGDRKLIALRAYAARYPGPSADVLQAADDAAIGQFESAAKKTLDLVGKAKPAEIAGQDGMNAARLVIEGAKAKRNQTVAPDYAAARDVKLPAPQAKTLNADPVLRDAAKKVMASPIYQRDLGSAAKETVTTKQGTPTFSREKVGGFYRSKETPTVVTMTSPPDTVGFWHQVKGNLDDQIERAANEPNKKRILSDARRMLNSTLEKSSSEYKSANAAYSKATAEIIEPLEKSAVGVLARIRDPNAAKAAARVLGDASVSPQELAKARSVIAGKDPEAWNGLVRQWLDSKLNKAFKDTQTGDVINPAGKFRQAVFGTPQDRQRMAAMLPSGAVKDFEDLMFAAEKLASTPIAGSNTMRDTEMKDQLKGTGAVIFRWFTSPRQAVVNAAEQRALEEGTSAITEALLDPAKRTQLRRVVKMAPSTRQAILLTSILTGQATKVAAQSETDLMPPALEAARSQ